MSSSITIAKNTFFLYIRMFLTMIVSLYTSRIVLNVLGIDDFGIYNIVGGVVALFGFFYAAMTSATQRFLSFEIGKNDFLKTAKVFSATLNIYIGIGLIVLLFAETIGLWFINNKLNIPLDRIEALNFVYQFSVLSFIVGMVRVPYNSLIIAKEKMGIYAIYSIVEVVFKLLIVFLLYLGKYDKLQLYAVLTFTVTTLVSVLYTFYCVSKFKESHYFFFYEKKLYNELISYSAWNLFGNFASVAKGQGVNVLLNLFFGTFVNAAYALTLQVQNAIGVFVSNFQLAINPQIIKSYAQNDIEHTQKLINKSAKFSYLLMLVLILPFLFNIDAVLELWLIQPPKYTSIFVSLCLINILIDSFSGPLMTGIQATGKIRKYQVVVGFLVFLNLPLSYFFLKLNQSPYFVWFVSIFIAIISLFFRIFFLSQVMKFNKKEFLTTIIFRLVLLSLIPFLFSYYFVNSFHLENEMSDLFLKITSIVFITLIVSYLFVIDKDEKKFIKKIMKIESID